MIAGPAGAGPSDLRTARRHPNGQKPKRGGRPLPQQRQPAAALVRSGAMASGTERRLDWDGCRNVRDLGGIPLADAVTHVRPGAVVRADGLDLLTAAGWRALQAHGVSTLIDLRHARERDEAPYDDRVPHGIDVVVAPLEDQDDLAFVERWGLQLGTPHYYSDALDRWPDRAATVLAHVARARPGGVVIHCSAGRDRTGLACALLLHVVGVDPATIAADHALSYDQVRGIHGDSPDPMTDGWQAEHAAAITGLLISRDIAAELTAAGLVESDLAALRTRLVAEPDPQPKPRTQQNVRRGRRPPRRARPGRPDRPLRGARSWASGPAPSGRRPAGRSARRDPGSAPPPPWR